jgi:hypothetical protein
MMFQLFESMEISGRDRIYRPCGTKFLTSNGSFISNGGEDQKPEYVPYRRPQVSPTVYARVQFTTGNDSARTAG